MSIKGSFQIEGSQFNVKEEQFCLSNLETGIFVTVNSLLICNEIKKNICKKMNKDLCVDQELDLSLGPTINLTLED